MSETPQAGVFSSRHFEQRSDTVDLFEGPRLKVARAKKHVVDFKATLDAFFQLNPVQIWPEKDAETGWLRTPMRLVQPIPGDLRLFAADALYNLRSALDQTVCRSAVAVGKMPDGTYFPHGNDLAGFEAAMRAKCKKVSVAVRDAIAALQPYYGGNGYLIRALHDLNVVDKHSELIKVALVPLNAELSMQKGPAPAGAATWKVTDDAFIPITAAQASATDAHQQIMITFTITFLGVEAIEREAATKVLGRLCDLVVHAIDVIEAALK